METKFMLLMVPVLESKRDLIPAFNYLSTAIVQTIYPDANPRYNRLFQQFGQTTIALIQSNILFNPLEVRLA